MNRRLFFVMVLACVLMIPSALLANCGTCEPKADCAKACEKACAQKCEKKADKCCGSDACKAACAQKCETKCQKKADKCCGSEACKAKGSCVKPCPTKKQKTPVADHGTKALPFINKIAGEWRGLAETRNDRVQPESLKTVLWIAADGTVTGRLGEWKLKDASIVRTNDRSRQNYQANWMITGTAEGMKTLEGAKNQVIISLDIAGTKAEGEIRGFAAEKKSGKIINHRWNLTHLNLYPVK